MSFSISMPNERASTQKIAYVNGLRGIAIIMVVWHHLVGQNIKISTISLKNIQYPFEVLAVSGWLGVNVFFVLSGFVLFLPFSADTKHFSSRQFLLRRCVRILPLYYINVGICIIVMLFFEPISRVIKHAAVYSVAAFPSPALFFPPYNPPLWSLGIEIWFSIVFPIFILLLRHFQITKLFLTVICLSIVVHLTGMFVARDVGSYLNPVSDTLPGRLSDFVIGMYAAFIWKNTQLSNSQKSILNAAGVALIAVAFAGSSAWFREALPTWTQSIWNLCLAVGVSAIIVGLKDTSPKILSRRILEFWPLQVVGLMCFSLYIWHWQLIELFTLSLGSPAWKSNPFGISTYIASLIAICGLSYRFIEFPRVKDVGSLFAIFPSSNSRS